MCGGYTLEWLDALITVSLNPVKTDFNAIHPVNSVELKSKIEEEKCKIQSILKRLVFSLGDEKKVALLVKQYHSDLTILLDQALENHAKCPVNLAELKDLTNTLVSTVDELLSFMGIRFLDYLSLNERVSAIYLSITKKDLKQRLNKITAKFKNDKAQARIVDLVLNELHAFIGCSKKEHIFNFKELAYMKEICKELEHLTDGKCGDINTYTCLDQLLVYLNFNSKGYIDNFIQRLAEKINSGQTIDDKTEILLLHFKKFKQMHRKPGMVFDSTYGDLDAEVSNWFAQEIYYLEKKLHYAIEPLNGYPVKSAHKNSDLLKVLCRLSVDQIAIVLRCVDDLKILVARSLNAVFKSIVPHLSTPCQENISYDSMRSKSYAVETRDKEVVIQTLEQMINKIREY
ncbi:MAG: hypothetical protein V4539_09400 [Bacteroidota bacterium]